VPNWFPKTSVEWLVVFTGLAMVAVLVLPPLHEISKVKAAPPVGQQRISYGDVLTLKLTGQKVSVVREAGFDRWTVLYADSLGHLNEIDVWERDLLRPGIDD